MRNAEVRLIIERRQSRVNELGDRHGRPNFSHRWFMGGSIWFIVDSDFNFENEG